MLAGTGGNGGGGLVCARHLYNWDAEVTVLLATKKEKLSPVTQHQLSILENMNLSIAEDVTSIPEINNETLIIDALIGYSLADNPRNNFASLIESANAEKVPILSLDTPSGLDTTTGQPADPTIKASATMTLALPKTGLIATGAKSYVGELYLTDISVPSQLYATYLNIEVPVNLFSKGSILKL